jgi:ubiquinone/menaquinone biosynthesis C-methylase UbiE
MPAEGRQAHWQSIYAAKSEREISWFQDDAQPSLDMIEEIASLFSAVVDIGGGASRLVDSLLNRGFLDLTILDLSSTALSTAKERIGEEASRVQWIEADVTTWEPSRTYDVWHDRATFHFMVEESDRSAYLSRLARALKPGGHAIIATFAPDVLDRLSAPGSSSYARDGTSTSRPGAQRSRSSSPCFVMSLPRRRNDEYAAQLASNPPRQALRLAFHLHPILIERALRDEGASLHYLPPSDYAEADPALVDTIAGALSRVGEPVERGTTWTTDAPYRETDQAIEAARTKGILAVEMEAAALYAFARARDKAVVCFAHVTNQMGQTGDFEKGEANGAVASLSVIDAAAGAWLASQPP